MAVKTGSIADYVADKLGVPAELRTTPAERQQIMEQAMQAAQMAAQAEAGVEPQGEAPTEGMI